MSTLYEIVELEDGEIALQRADEPSEPLVRIRFSEESLYFLNEAKYDVAKAMIEAGLEAASEFKEEGTVGSEPSPNSEGLVLH